MGDPQVTKKKNRKKKKSTIGESSSLVKEAPSASKAVKEVSSVSNTCKEASNASNTVKKASNASNTVKEASSASNIVKGASELADKNQACNLNEFLPQKVGWTTMINEMEVTMTQENSEDPTAKKKSKKKKKKANKQPSSESVTEPLNNDIENSPNLLNFSKSGISLVNHPEISVTVNDIPKEIKINNPLADVPKDTKITNPEKVTQKETKIGTANNSQKEKTQDTNRGNAHKVKSDVANADAAQKVKQDDANEGNNTTKKKKKKKKKKNSQGEPLTAPTAEAVVEEPAQSAPTYVKLPATGDTCVLVVSHESFANGNVLDKPKTPNNNASLPNSIQSGSLNQSNTVTLLNTNATKFSSLMPIAIPDILGNSAQTLPFIGNSTSSISLTPIPNANVEPAANQQEENKEEEPKLTKAQLKAERRAKQEAQRAAKEAKNVDKAVVDKPAAAAPLKTPGIQDGSVPKYVPPAKSDKSTKETSKSSTEKDQLHQIRLFSHLPQYKTLEVLLKHISKTGNLIHPAILGIGTQFSRGIVCGSNSRCIALLAAVKEVIKDHVKLADKDFLKDLDSKLQFYMSFLQSCRPLSVSMVNAMKFLKHQMNHLNKELGDSDIKIELFEIIDKFVREEILLAKEQIGTCAADKIVNGDVILVFAYSSLVKEVLCKAFQQSKKFRVVVVDSRPKMEALKMLNCLVKEGISCSYTLINGISYAMREVSKVIIGAHALLSNGYVMSRMGCSQIALVAASYRVPVLVCCETYKFWERVLTDSFVHNELGSPEVLINTGHDDETLKGWQDLPSLQILNLLYDVTPPDLISVVITEKGVLPCTSVPVVLRVRHAGLQE